MEIVVLVVDGGLDAGLANGSQVTGRQLVANLRILGQEYERYIKGSELSGQMLHVRSGQGRRSIFHRVEVNAAEGSVDLIIGADLGKARYMRAQALGATIRPTRGRYLAIPLEAARTGNGVARFSARELMASPEAFGYQGAFIHNSVVFGVKRRARSKSDIGEVVPLFALKASVTLPSRNYLTAARYAMDARTRQLAGDAAEAGVRAIVQSVGPIGGSEAQP